MTSKTIWLNPYIMQTRIIPTGTTLPDGETVTDGPALMITHDDDLTLIMELPHETHEFLAAATELLKEHL